MIVRIVMRITGDLLTLGRYSTIFITQRVMFSMRMEELLGVLVFHCNGIEVSDFYGYVMSAERKLSSSPGLDLP